LIQRNIKRRINRKQEKTCKLLKKVKLQKPFKLLGDEPADITSETSLYGGPTLPYVETESYFSSRDSVSSDGSVQFSDYITVRFIEEGCFGKVNSNKCIKQELI
jgi:hypothetical protein